MQKKLVLAATLMVFGWVNAQTAANDSIELSRDLEEIVVSSTRMGGKTSQTAETFTADKLEERNIGVNLPYLLSGNRRRSLLHRTTVWVSSYTYPHSRHRPKSHQHDHKRRTTQRQRSQTVFWVNMTDLAASMNSVNVQRGVGSSTNAHRHSAHR